MSLSKMVSQSSDTQQDLERTKHSLQAKLAEIEVLENQQDELNRRLMVWQLPNSAMDSISPFLTPMMSPCGDRFVGGSAGRSRDS